MASLLELWPAHLPATGREEFRCQETVLNWFIPVSQSILNVNVFFFLLNATEILFGETPYLLCSAPWGLQVLTHPTSPLPEGLVTS